MATVMVRPSRVLAVIVLAAAVAAVALVGVSGLADAGSGPTTTETVVIDEGPFQGTPIDE